MTMANSVEPPLWNTLPNAPALGTFVAALCDLPEGEATLRTLPSCNDAAHAKPFGVIVLRTGNEVKAFVNRCAHFGVPLAAKQQQLIFKPHISISCNVHYARYRWSDGVCEYGDCEGETLIAVPLQMSDSGGITIG
jgi:nitrite reductase/ring-hydroxylating ferredoxin subunit